jgi:hypothetical protein
MQVPVKDLQSRISVLLNGIAPILGRDLAVGYVQRSLQLRYMIGDPHKTVQHLQGCYQAYLEVVGVPPRAALLAASESSHIARLTVPTFRRKLEDFVKRCAVWAINPRGRTPICAGSAATYALYTHTGVLA